MFAFLNLLTFIMSINGLFTVFDGPVFMGPYLASGFAVGTMGLWATWLVARRAKAEGRE